MSAYNQRKRGTLAANSVLNLAGQVLPMLVGIATIPLIVRGLGTDGYGILSIAFMVLGYFSIFDLGLSRATVKFVSEHLRPEQIREVPRLVWTSLGLLTVLGCLGGAIAAAFVPMAVAHYLKIPPALVPESKLSLYVLCASMPIMLSNDALRGVLEATQRFDLVNYVKVPGSVCFYLFAAIGVIAGIKVSGIVLILVLVRLATSFLYLVLCFRVIPELRRFELSRDAIRPLATFGGWIMVSNITAPIFTSAERFIIATVLSVGALTYYSVPFDLVTKVLIFPASIAPALFPYFSYHGVEGTKEVSHVTSKSIKYLLLVMTPVTSVFVVFAGTILRLWMGPQFAAQSSTVMQLIATMCFLNAFAYIPYTSVQALGRPDLKAILDVAILPVYVASAWWLARHMGVNGAALAKLLVTVLDCTALYVFAWRMKSFSPRDMLTGAVRRAGFVSAGLLMAVWFLGSLHLALLPTICALSACLLCYAGAFWAVAIDSSESNAIRTLYQRVLFPSWREEIPTIEQI